MYECVYMCMFALRMYVFMCVCFCLSVCVRVRACMLSVCRLSVYSCMYVYID